MRAGVAMDAGHGQQLVQARDIPVHLRAYDGPHMSPVVVEGGEGDVLLAGKIAVDAALGQPSRSGEVRHRGPGVTLRIEDGRRARDDELTGLLGLAHASKIPNGIK